MTVCLEAFVQNALKFTQFVNFSGQEEIVCKNEKTTTQAKELLEDSSTYAQWKASNLKWKQKYADTEMAPPIGLTTI